MRRLTFIFCAIFFIGPLNKGIAQDDAQSGLEASLVGVPVFDFEHGYYGFAGNLSIRSELFSNLYIGVNFFHHERDLSMQAIPSGSRTNGLLPSLRYYVFSTPGLTVFSEVAYGFGRVKYEPENGGTYQENPDAAITVFEAGFGAQYRMSKKLGVEVVIPYLLVNNKTSNAQAPILFEGIGPAIGLNFKIK